MLEQSSKKNSFFNNYKKKIINKLDNTKEIYQESSGNWIFLNRLGYNLISIASWIIIASFVYIWWQSIGQPIGCERITPELCNMCFNNFKLGGLLR